MQNPDTQIKTIEEQIWESEIMRDGQLSKKSE